MRKTASEYLDTLSNVKDMGSGTYIAKSNHAYTIVKVNSETSYEVRHVSHELLDIISKY